MRRAGRRLRRSLYLILLLMTGTLICAGWLVPLARLRRHTAARQRAWLVGAWMRALLGILNVRLRCTGVPHSGPALIVGNHISWLDIPCLFANLDGVFVAKRDVARWPVIGLLARAAGTIFMTRGRESNRTAELMTWRLAQGEHVVIFPEGTSSDGTEVGPFHARLFQAAIRAHTVVQAVAIGYPPARDQPSIAPFVGNDDLLHHLWRLIGEETIAVQMTFCPPLVAAGLSRRALAIRAREQIRTALGIDPPLTLAAS